MKRVILFLLTNFAVMIVFGIVLNVIFALTGIKSTGTMGLMMLAGLFGFGGSIVSLLLSKTIALRQVGAKIITAPQTPEERWLVDTIAELSQKVAIGMPTVAIYQASEMNAFATGSNRNDALVAVSSGLLESMTRDEVQAVLAHEISHIKNGDMITLTLLQGIVNTFVIFISRLIARLFSTSNDGAFSSGRYFLISMLMDVIFGFLASFITRWFSRQREFRADAGAAMLVGNNKMISALERLKGNLEPSLDDSMLAFGITGKYNLSELMMTHPPLDKRIDALRHG